MGKGGVSKSLANLLNCIDYSLYNVDLFLFEKKGMFLSQIPKEVNVLDENKRLREHLLDGKIYEVIMATINAKKKYQSIEEKWLNFWKYNKRLYQKNNNEYDVAISYNDGIELYYLVEWRKAKKKMGDDHIDYSNSLTYKPNLDRKYYNALDYIITVSNTCALQLKKIFPEYSDKIRVVENIVKKENLISMAGQLDPYEQMFQNRKNIFVIVTVAGLYMRKGYDISAEALKNIKMKGYNFRWIIIGTGPDEDKILSIIREVGIENEVVLMHEQSNPYQYIRWANLFMLTSYAEGKSMAVEEAKLLEKPIIITNYSSASDQIKDEFNGLIAEISSESITEKIEEIINNKLLVNNLTNNLKLNCFSNEEENMKKIYDIWDN